MIQQSFDLQQAQDAVREALATIDAQLAAAAAHLEAIEAAMVALDEAGMYPALPSREAWEHRNGGAPIYFYHYFTQDRRTGQYQGPGGKRKVYVGCRAENVAEARRLAENRRRWEELDQARSRLEGWLHSIRTQVGRFTDEAQALARRSGGYVQADLEAYAPADPDVLAQIAEEELAQQAQLT